MLGLSSNLSRGGGLSKGVPLIRIWKAIRSSHSPPGGLPMGVLTGVDSVEADTAVAVDTGSTLVWSGKCLRLPMFDLIFGSNKNEKALIIQFLKGNFTDVGQKEVISIYVYMWIFWWLLNIHSTKIWTWFGNLNLILGDKCVRITNDNIDATE